MSLIESISSNHGVAWIYKNNGFIGCEVGETAKVIHKNMGKIVK
jgi:hypothetical protein